MRQFKLIKRIHKRNLVDKQGKYDVYYELWWNVREMALPFDLTIYTDKIEFSILFLHFTKYKSYRPTEINSTNGNPVNKYYKVVYPG